ncbi:MAG: cell division protein FtsL [Proteobacteria bacterium]|jgi:cell division protein FtsL|nr:cell division protein FtsL [Pseudomonadota bacterium]MDA1299097.1 cell division protein FtsL [Pseudomonadota bacterium]
MIMPLGAIWKWLLVPMHIVTALTSVLVLVSAVAVVGASHETRRLYRSLQEQTAERDRLESEYERLLLEQSAWANNTRVDQIAHQDLDMVVPATREIVIVRVR